MVPNVFQPLKCDYICKFFSVQTCDFRELVFCQPFNVLWPINMPKAKARDKMEQHFYYTFPTLQCSYNWRTHIYDDHTEQKNTTGKTEKILDDLHFLFIDLSIHEHLESFNHSLTLENYFIDICTTLM